MNAKKHIAVAAALLVTCCLPRQGHACTGFADYSGAPVIGMNFDYPQTDIRFMLYSLDGIDILSFEFLENGIWIPTAGLNSEGLFVATQLELPAKPAKYPAGSSELKIADAGRWISDGKSTGEIAERLKGKRLVDGPTTIHHLFADKHGHAAIIEAADSGNYVKENAPGSFLVMTNFAVSKFDGKPYTAVYGAGDDRYKTASGMLEQRAGAVTAQAGFDILKATAVSSGTYPTLCSMVVDPAAGTIRFALGRNFGKIWVASIKNKTIQEENSSQSGTAIVMGKDGVTASTLTGSSGAMTGAATTADAAKAPTATDIISLICGAFVFILLIRFMIKQRR